MEPKNMMKTLADALGFTFREGIDAFVESEFLQKMLDQQNIPAVAGILQNELVRAMLAKVFIGAAVGSYRDYESFVMFTAHPNPKKTQVPTIQIFLAFPKPFSHGLEIRPLAFGDRFLSFFGLGNRIYTGDRNLDGILMITARDQPEVCRLVSPQSVQKSLLQVFENQTAAKVADFGVGRSEPADTDPLERARSSLKLQADLADALFGRSDGNSSGEFSH
jgi:hypothetical protein